MEKRIIPNNHSQCDIYYGARYVPEKPWHKTITYINAPAVGVMAKGKIMDNVKISFAKLAGALKAIRSLLNDTEGKARPQGTFWASDVKMYFITVMEQVDVLRQELPALFIDFSDIDIHPDTQMPEGSKEPFAFRRAKLESLARDIDQIFEIRANSELATPIKDEFKNRIFISHGRPNDWYQVQSYIERDLGLKTMELAQEPSQGRTILEKLYQEAEKCDYAVIVMTGDDCDGEGNRRSRENVMHEIGYFQGKYGLSAVCLLHEEGTSIPSNIHGLVYAPFPKGYINASFSLLQREIQAYYKKQP